MPLTSRDGTKESPSCLAILKDEHTLVQFEPIHKMTSIRAFDRGSIDIAISKALIIIY